MFPPLFPYEYESVRHDFEAWSRFIVPHGFVCIHDVANSENIARFYRELLQGQQAFKEVATVVSMKILERV